jgi:hypothetical protein
MESITERAVIVERDRDRFAVTREARRGSSVHYRRDLRELRAGMVF